MGTVPSGVCEGKFSLGTEGALGVGVPAGIGLETLLAEAGGAGRLS
jgi:hypothetical protein